MDANQSLRETLDRAREELRAARAQAERSQHEAERCSYSLRPFSEVLLSPGFDQPAVCCCFSRMVEDQLVEKHRLQQREAELQQKYSQAKEKLQRAAAAQKKVRIMTSICFYRLKQQ